MHRITIRMSGLFITWSRDKRQHVVIQNGPQRSVIFDTERESLCYICFKICCCWELFLNFEAWPWFYNKNLKKRHKFIMLCHVYTFYHVINNYIFWLIQRNSIKFLIESKCWLQKKWCKQFILYNTTPGEGHYIRCIVGHYFWINPCTCISNASKVSYVYMYTSWGRNEASKGIIISQRLRYKS